MDAYVTKEIPTLDLLEKIIMDDNLFGKFSNNKELEFNGFLVEDLKKHLKDYIQSRIHSNQDITEKFLKRAKYISDKFRLDIPSFRQVRDDLDPEFYNFIMEGIDTLNDPLSKARAIYLKLAKVLCYDENFVAYNQNLKVEHLENRYLTIF